MSHYKKGETIWVFSEGEFKNEIVQAKVLTHDNSIEFVTYRSKNDRERGAFTWHIHRSRKALIDKLINELNKQFVEDTDYLRGAIKQLNDKMLAIEAKYETKLDFLNAQKEDGDGN